MTENEKAIVALLEEQNMLLYDILSLSEPFKPTNDDVEKYIEFMQARQEKFDSINDLVEKLKKIGFDQSAFSSTGKTEGSIDFKKVLEDLYNAGRATTYRIREIDLSHKPIMEEIRNSFMDELKTLKTRKSAKSLYSDDNMPNSRNYFNQTK